VRSSIGVIIIAAVAAAIAMARPAFADDATKKANLVALEQMLVITTDDRYYTAFPHDGMKMDPLTGLPFARSEREEIASAFATNWMLRNSHHQRLLNFTVTAFPTLERSIIGAGFHYWKTPIH